MAEGTSKSGWRFPSIILASLVLLPAGPLVGDKLAARCCGWRWNWRRCWEWEGIGVRWGDRKPAGCARGGSRLSAELKRERACEVVAVGLFGWLVTRGRETGSKYWTPPGRDKGEMTDEA